MRDCVYLGSAPAEEPCAQVGDPDYLANAIVECRRYAALIRKVVGPEPPGASLRLKFEAHDLGQMVELVCYFDDGTAPGADHTAAEYAYRCESEAPVTWAA